MGIRFLCPACEKKIHVKQHQAGLRGFCPKCGAKIDIPSHSTLLSKKRPGAAAGTLMRPGVAPGAVGEQTLMSLLPSVGRLIAASSTPPRDPLDEFPAYQWYVVPPGGSEPFGPADGAMVRQWLHEGRIAAGSMVWRQDWPQWRKAGGIWSRLLLVEGGVRSLPSRPVAAVGTGGGPNIPMTTAVAGIVAASNPVPQPATAEAAFSAVPRPTASTSGTLERTSFSPKSTDVHEPELYYPRRSPGTYLAMIVFLVVAVVVLGIVMVRVIDAQRSVRDDRSNASRRSEPPFFPASQII